MESQEQYAAQPFLRSENETDRYTRVHNLDPDEATDESVDDDEELDEE